MSSPGKKAPRYDLSEIQTNFASGDPTRYAITQLAADEARKTLGFSESHIKACIAQLTAADFYKPMPATNRAARKKGLWQDVYRTECGGAQVYLKLQLTAEGRAVLINCKRK
jgi:hypothetical protein